jgi:hypothetical protein
MIYIIKVTTNKEDKALAIQNICKLIQQGIYPDNLWK